MLARELGAHTLNGLHHNGLTTRLDEWEEPVGKRGGAGGKREEPIGGISRRMQRQEYRSKGRQGRERITYSLKIQQRRN